MMVLSSDILTVILNRPYDNLILLGAFFEIMADVFMSLDNI